MKFTNKLTIFLTVLFAISLSTRISAKEPTKEETIDFIKQKTGIDYTYDCRTPKCAVEQRLYFSECALVVRDINIYSGERRSYYEYHIDLSKLDPSKVTTEMGEVIPPYVFLWVKGHKEKIMKDIIDKGQPDRQAWESSIKIFTSALDQAGTARAFQHLITLCGGTGELF